MRRFAITVALAVSMIPSVSAAGPEPLKWSTLQNAIAYFAIPKLTKDIVPRIRPTMQQIAESKPRGLIIDLRGNQGGEIDAVDALMNTLLPKGRPYMRTYIGNVKRIQYTTESNVLKPSTPVVLARDPWTGNESDIIIYALQKNRKAGVMEFSPHRSALLRIYKQHASMNQFRPIKEAVFFAKPDVRLIGDEGADQDDVIPRAISFVRELSPWDEPRAVAKNP